MCLMSSFPKFQLPFHLKLQTYILLITADNPHGENATIDALKFN